MASKKLSDFGIKVPKQMSTSELGTSQTMSSFAKWVPLICAGAAVGVSVLALKEIKNVRKELMSLKKDSIGNVVPSTSPELTKKMELMDEQLRKITHYLSNQNKQKEQVVKNVVSPKKEPVNIINNDPVEDLEEVEYEEVTDDEAES